MKRLLQEEEDTLVLLGTLEQAKKRYGQGNKSMREEADKAKAIVRIGKRVRYNFAILDRYYGKQSRGYWDGQ